MSSIHLCGQVGRSPRHTCFKGWKYSRSARMNPGNCLRHMGWMCRSFAICGVMDMVLEQVSISNHCFELCLNISKFIGSRFQWHVLCKVTAAGSFTHPLRWGTFGKGWAWGDRVTRYLHSRVTRLACKLWRFFWCYSTHLGASFC